MRTIEDMGERAREAAAVLAAAGSREKDRGLAAIAAGCDMVVTTDFQTQIPQVLSALEDGSLSQSRVDQAVRRVLGWKYDLGLI